MSIGELGCDSIHNSHVTKVQFEKEMCKLPFSLLFCNFLRGFCDIFHDDFFDVFKLY